MKKSTAISRQEILFLTQSALLSAVIVLMTFVPYLGYIAYGGLFSITLIHLPVIIGAVALGPKHAAVLGLVWGISCWIKAIFMPPSPVDGVIFRNPLMSIIPRVLCALVAAFVYIGFKKLIKKASVAQGVGSAVAAVLGTLTNTVLVLGGIYFFFGKHVNVTSISFGGLLNFIIATAGINGLLEMIVAAILVPPICAALAKIKTTA